MKFLEAALLIVVTFGLFSAGVQANDCEDVDGRITSEVVSEFADGTTCPSMIGLCTEGRFTGDLEARFRFVANTLSPFGLLIPPPPVTQPNVAATTGVISVDAAICGGVLALNDTSVFSLDPDGAFASLQTPDPAASTANCAEVSGRIRAQGIFIGGCVDCKYEGEICGLEAVDDDDDDHADDDD